MENHHFQWVNPLQMVIFNSYVKLLEGMMGIKKYIYISAKCHWNVTGMMLILLEELSPSCPNISAIFRFAHVCRLSQRAGVVHTF